MDSRPSLRKRWSIRSRRRRSDNTTNRPDGGPLDPHNRLANIYAEFCSTQELEKCTKALFPDVRILVAGRSGAGKSTLIRLLLGEGGPEISSDGMPGNQDIYRPWVLHDSSVPLFLYDSNGTDTQGSNRLIDVETFLETMKRENTPIHLAWYVVNGTDNRLRDDGGILGLLSRQNIPFLLVITHNDDEDKIRRIFTDDMLEKLLEGVADKEAVKQQMVRVGNRVTLQNKQLHKEKVDVKALKLVVNRTMELMKGEDMKRTWIASQVVDMRAKLTESASIVVRYMILGLFTGALGIMPGVREVEAAFVYVHILVVLCKVWRVPKNLEKALCQIITKPEVTHRVLQDLFRDCMVLLGFAAAVGATVMTAGAASPAIFTWLVAHGLATGKVSKASMSVRGCYAILLLGCIMYVKSIGGLYADWNEEASVEEFMSLSGAFASSERAVGLSNVIKQMDSATGLPLKRKEHIDKLVQVLVQCFGEMILHRPDSLRTLLDEEIQESSAPGNAVDHLAENLASVSTQGNQYNGE